MTAVGAIRWQSSAAVFTAAVAVLLVLAVTPASSVSLILGDSYFTDRHMLPDILNKYTNGSFESAAVGGASLHEGDVPSVPDEWREARNRTKWTTVLIDAGANDIITWKEPCRSLEEQCMRVLNESAALYWDMVHDMKAVGVQHIVFLGFIPVEGLDAAFDEISYKFIAMCKLSPVPCTYVDLRAPPVSLGPDKNHPTAEGYADVANRTIDAIRNKNITL